MKVFLLLSLLIVATFQVTTNEYVTCVNNIDRSSCNTECSNKLDTCRDTDGDV